MQRLPLRFENIQQIASADELSVIILTDMKRRRALSVVCDNAIAQQIIMRIKTPKELTQTMLPEAMAQLLGPDYEMTVMDVSQGQYQVMLSDLKSLRYQRLRMSDAVLLSIISDIPLYIDKPLMERQSSPFDENADGVSVPINSMDTPRLRQAMQQAVEDENYELASQLRDEIERRRQ